MKIKHISYSAVKEAENCPYRFKLLYVDRVRPSIGNEFTTFGNAIHSVLEKQVAAETKEEWDDYFDLKFIEYIKNAYDNGAKKPFDKVLIEDMRRQGKEIIKEALPFLKEHFGEFEIVGTEIKLYEDLTENIKFKGFIDLVIKTSDGKYCIIDHKSCSWGWDRDKRSNKMILYQIVLYKHFFAKKYNIDPKDIETYFVLLKRIAKPNKKIEPFRVTSGKKRVENALKIVERAISYVEKGFYMKNRLYCSKCDFNNTEFCKK